jgi:integrase
VLTILKAALNFVVDRRLADVPDAPWQKVKPFKGTSNARVRFLQPHEQVRLINACPAEFRDLVRGALMTGCRYSELARLQCKDYNFKADIPTIFIAESKNGKTRHIVLNTEGAALFDELTAKKSPQDLVFTNSIKRTKRPHSNGGWLESDQKRFIKEACAKAGLEPISFHELRHSYASMLVNNKCPLPVVAQQLGHSDSRMVERHYGHLVPSYVADMVRAAMPTLGITGHIKEKKAKFSKNPRQITSPRQK